MENSRTELLKIENEIIEESIRRGVFDVTSEQVKKVKEPKLHKHAKSSESNSISLLFNEKTNEYQKSLKTMNALADNHAFRPISSHRKLLGFIIIFFKRIVRRLLKWYIEPISDQQTDFNFAAIGAINSTNNSVAILYQNNLETMSYVSDLVLEVEKLKKAYINLEKAQGRQDKEESNICESFVPKHSYHEDSFSFGSAEGIIILHVLKTVGIPYRKCTYLDISISGKNSFNTSGFLYRKGARGVLVEEDPSLIQSLIFERSGDILLNSFIIDREEEVVNDDINKQNISAPFYSQVKNILEENNGRVRENVNVEGISISEIIKHYLHVVPVLLIINSENEKKNMELIKYIHLENHRPLILIVSAGESLKILGNNRNTSIREYMSTLNYYEYAFTGLNSIYVDKNQIENSSMFIL